MSEIAFPDQVAEVLHKAQEILQERGWIKFAPENSDGVCSLGAVCIATRDLHARGNEFAAWPVDTIHILQEELMREGHLPSVTVWNDAPERTVEDVLLLFKKAEERCHEQSA